jgi:hypothetical protein
VSNSELLNFTLRAKEWVERDALRNKKSITDFFSKNIIIINVYWLKINMP